MPPDVSKCSLKLQTFYAFLSSRFFQHDNTLFFQYSLSSRVPVFGRKLRHKRNLVPRSRGWAKPKARSGQVRKFDFFDWLFQNMAVTVLKFERALRGFSGPLGNSMSVFMQIRHCARNHNICILGTFRCLQSASKVKKISSQFFIAL